MNVGIGVGVAISVGVGISVGAGVSSPLPPHAANTGTISTKARVRAVNLHLRFLFGHMANYLLAIDSSCHTTTHRYAVHISIIIGVIIFGNNPYVLTWG